MKAFPTKITILILVISLSFTIISTFNTNQNQNQDTNIHKEKTPIQKSTSEEIKKKAKWESYEWDDNPFRDHTLTQIKSLVGLEKLLIDETNLFSLIDDDDHSLEETLPRNFDSRTVWPECVNEVRNQDHCGSCWAFSASEVLSDRFCIASKSKIKPILSPQDMVSCDESNSGCQGGQLDKAWKYLENYGIVEDSCFPYESGDGKTMPKCIQGNCVNTQNKFKKFKSKINSSKAYQCPTQIKKEIFENGPIQTGFFVYEDFMHYKSGIYEYTHGRKLGGHAVKIIGWGEENGTPYWIVQNSWGKTWGENGFFRIKMGECMIDRNGFAGNANVEDLFIDFSPKGFLIKE